MRRPQLEREFLQDSNAAFLRLLAPGLQVSDELAALKARQADVSVLRAARRWLHRDAEKVPARAREHIALARQAHPVLDKMVSMREELRQLWLNTSRTREQLTADLQAWCQRAEESGVAALRDFSLRLRAAQA